MNYVKGVRTEMLADRYFIRIGTERKEAAQVFENNFGFYPFRR